MKISKNVRKFKYSVSHEVETPFGVYWDNWKTYEVVCPEHAKEQYVKEKFPGMKVFLQGGMIKVYYEEAHNFRFSIRCVEGDLEKKTFYQITKKQFVKFRNFIDKQANKIITIVAYSIVLTMLTAKTFPIGLLLTALLILLVPIVLINMAFIRSH